MFSEGNSYNWNGNSFSDCGVMMQPDAIVRPVPPYKLGISQAAMIRGEGMV